MWNQSFFSLRRFEGRSTKKHLLILSNDKTAEQNFAKLCVLNFFLLDVSLGFFAGCKAVAQSAEDRPKKNYGLKYSRTLYAVEQMSNLIEGWSQTGACISIALKSQIYKHLEKTHGYIFKINMFQLWAAQLLCDLPGSPTQSRTHLMPLLISLAGHQDVLQQQLSHLCHNRQKLNSEWVLKWDKVCRDEDRK